MQGAEVLQSAKLYGNLKAALTGTGLDGLLTGMDSYDSRRLAAGQRGVKVILKLQGRLLIHKTPPSCFSSSTVIYIYLYW